MSTPALDVVMGLNRAHATLKQLLDERLGRWHGLGFSDFVLLGELAQAPDGRLSTRQLAATLRLQPSTLVRQLMPLEKTGLITRESGTVCLRAAGRALYREASQTAAPICDAAWASIGLDEVTRAALLDTMDALARSPALALP